MAPCETDRQRAPLGGERDRDLSLGGSPETAVNLHFPVLLFNLASVVTGLAAEEERSYRAIPLSVPAFGKTGFTLLAPSETGITFSNRLELRRGLVNQNLMNGSGVAAGDVD